MTRTTLRALAVATAGGAGLLASGAADPAHALRGWIAAYGFGISTAVGALMLVMFFHVTHATWPVVLRPHLMRIVATVPVFTVLFVPIAFGLRTVYPWASSAPGLDEEMQLVVEHQRTWNNPAFFITRAVVYLGVWSAVAIALGRAEVAYARGSKEDASARLRRISAGGIVVVALTLTFAAFDWLMALEPGWISNMIGVYVFAAGLSAAIALLTILVWLARRSGELPGSVGGAHFLALGRLMLMSVVLWAYIAFFQFMLIWIGNLPREVTFYVARSEGSFGLLSAILLAGHFALPFVVLLSRPLKMSGAALATVGAWMLLMNGVDFAWLVLPSGREGLSPLDLAPFLALGGLAVAFGASRVSRPATVAEGVMNGARSDAALEESLRYRSP